MYFAFWQVLVLNMHQEKWFMKVFGSTEKGMGKAFNTTRKKLAFTIQVIFQIQKSLQEFELESLK